MHFSFGILNAEMIQHKVVGLFNTG